MVENLPCLQITSILRKENLFCFSVTWCDKNLGIFENTEKDHSIWREQKYGQHNIDKDCCNDTQV